MIIESDFIIEVTAAFRTVNARVRLYRMLDWLDLSQVAYWHTDSIIFTVSKNNPKHKHVHTNCQCLMVLSLARGWDN